MLRESTKVYVGLLMLLTTNFLASVSMAAPKIEVWTDELPIRQPWLRDHLPDDSLAYVRVPHLFGLLATPKGNALDPALRSKANIENLEKIRKGFTNNVLPHIPAFANVQLRLLEEHLRSPVEMAFFLADAPSVLISVNLNLDSNEAFAEMLELMGVPLLEPLDDQGVGQVGVVPVPVFVQFDAASGRLLILGGTTVTAVVFDAALAGTQRSASHAMGKMESRVDESGQGFFLWVDAERAIPMLEAVLSPEDAAVWAASGLDQFSSAGMGWGVANGKGRISLMAELPSDAERGFVPYVSNNIAATSVGAPDGMFLMSIPSASEFSRLEALALENAEAETQLNWGDGKAKFTEVTGITIEEVFSAVGPELMIVADKVGDYTIIRLRDAKLWNSMLSRIAKKTGKPLDKKRINGKTYYHATLPNEFGLLSEDEAGEIGWFAVLFARQRDHLYWIQDGDYLYIASTPQILIDRSSMSERTDIGEWLEHQQRIDTSEAIMSVNGTGRKLPARLYASYISILHFLADIGETEIDVWAMPTARQLQLPDIGTFGFNINLGDPGLSAELTFENNPGELLGGVGGVAMVGILAAVAIPAYQDYSIRAQVSSGFILGAGLKVELTAFYVENGRFPDINEAEEMSVLETDSEHVVSAIVAPDSGLIIVQYEDSVNGGGELYLEVEDVYDGIPEWSCSATFDDTHLPEECRTEEFEYDDDYDYDEESS